MVFTNRWVYGIIDAVNGTLTVSSDSIIASSSTKVEDYGTYWRFSLTATDNQSNTVLDITYYATLSTNGTSTGVGAGSVRTVWGFQLEIGASYATSYIPTLGSTVTRLADAASKTGISSLIGSTTGSVFVDFEIFTTTGFGGIIEIINTSIVTQRLLIWENSGTSLELNIGSGIGGSSISTPATIGRHKALFTYTSGAIKFFLDGVKIGQSTPTSLSGGFNKLDFYHAQGGVFTQKKHINQALLFTSELTEAQAIELTTL